MTGRDHIDPVVPDITAVRRDDDLLSALSTRRASGRADDEAIRLLRALIADIDVDASPLPVTVRPAAKPAPRTRPGRRRRARAVVSFGVATLMLTTTGAAAASGGMGAAVSRFITGPEADRPYRDPRADLERAEKAMESRQYDTARASLERARHKRRALHGSEASDVDKKVGRLESRLPHAPSPFPRPWLPPPSPQTDQPDDLQRAAQSAAEQWLREAQSEAQTEPQSAFRKPPLVNGP